MQLLEKSLTPPHTEPNELDWKNGLSPNKDRLAEHLSAFANQSGGGFLAFGIDASTRAVCGVDQDFVDKATTDLANLGRDALEPPIVIDHAVEAFGGSRVLLVHVLESQVKPVKRRGQSIEHTWIRSGGTTRKASRAEVGGLLMGSRAPTWESQRASTCMDASELAARLDLPRVCKLLERPVPDGPDEVLRWLASEKFIELDGQGGYVTRLGAIAAARALEDFDGLARKQLRVVRYRGLNKTETLEEDSARGGYATTFESLVMGLKRVLPRSEVIRAALRHETTVYPELALRELAANTLIHQDFSVTGAGPMIEIFDDRIEFTSPGDLLPGKTVDRLIGATPESRNEALASAFRRYRICEERGSGFQKVVAQIELYGLPPWASTPRGGPSRSCSEPRARSAR